MNRLTYKCQHPGDLTQELVDASVRFFEERGYSLGVDWPYKGTVVPLAWYGKDKRVVSIMFKVNRRLYLKEGSSVKSKKYGVISRVVSEFLEMIRLDAAIFSSYDGGR